MGSSSQADGKSTSCSVAIVTPFPPFVCVRAEAEEGGSPARTAVASDQEDSRTAAMGKRVACSVKREQRRPRVAFTYRLACRRRSRVPRRLCDVGSFQRHRAGAGVEK